MIKEDDVHEDDMNEIRRNLNIKELRAVEETVNILASNVMINVKYHPPTNIPPYIKVENPMQQCNTLMAFCFNKNLPIFYGYFGGPENELAIHRNFKSLSECFIKVLTTDLESINKLKAKQDPLEESYAEFLKRNDSFPLYIYGFLFGLIEYSTKFDFEQDEKTWIIHYLNLKEISLYGY